VGHPLLGNSLSLLLASVTDKEPVSGPETLSSVHVQTQFVNRTGAGSASSRGSTYRFSIWSLKRVVGTLGT